MGSGTSYEVSGIAQGQKSEIGLIKWFDNKGVNLGSNFITSGEPETIIVTVELSKGGQKQDGKAGMTA